MKTDSEIVRHRDGGMTFAGPDAVALYRGVVLVSALKLYAKTGMKPNRAWTPTVMLKMATGISGRSYKRGQYESAAADVQQWVDVMKAALPVSKR